MKSSSEHNSPGSANNKGSPTTTISWGEMTIVDRQIGETKSRLWILVGPSYQMENRSRMWVIFFMKDWYADQILCNSTPDIHRVWGSSKRKFWLGWSILHGRGTLTIRKTISQRNKTWLHRCYIYAMHLTYYVIFFLWSIKFRFLGHFWKLTPLNSFISHIIYKIQDDIYNLEEESSLDNLNFNKYLIKLYDSICS